MTTTDTSSLAEAFTAGFAGRAITAADRDYDAARAVWNGSIDLRPAVIARCSTPADVVAAGNLTRAAGGPLAVRGGGHSVGGLSSCDGGVVIDLTGMRGIPGGEDPPGPPGGPGGPRAGLDA